jgi:hypothetical protein
VRKGGGSVDIQSAQKGSGKPCLGREEGMQ